MTQKTTRIKVPSTTDFRKAFNDPVHGSRQLYIDGDLYEIVRIIDDTTMTVRWVGTVENGEAPR